MNKPPTLQELRKRSGLSQSSLARKLRLNQMTVSSWERGLSRPSHANIERLSETLGCTEAEIRQLFATNEEE